MRNVVEEGRILRNESDELLEKLILFWMDLTKCMHFIFDAHFPALVQELKEFFDLRFGELVEHFIGLEVLDLSNNILSFNVKFGKFLSRVSETTCINEFWEGQLKLFGSCNNLEVSLVLLILMVIENVSTLRSVLLFELFPGLTFFIVLDFFIDMLDSFRNYFLFLFWEVAAKQTVTAQHEQFLISHVFKIIVRTCLIHLDLRTRAQAIIFILV